MSDMTNEAYFQKALTFLNLIGIKIIYRIIEEDGFLPGFLIEGGSIVIDKNKIKFPGDILHEAAHLAVVRSVERTRLDGKDISKRNDAAAEEMMAIAWSYAACVYLEIDPRFVFHGYGYHGEAGSITANFEKGNYFGVPVLEWLGMTSTSSKSNINFPAMIKWLRD
jgi:hypothetical protein